jgi:hypothetical protein
MDSYTAKLRGRTIELIVNIKNKIIQFLYFYIISLFCLLVRGFPLNQTDKWHQRQMLQNLFPLLEGEVS